MASCAARTLGPGDVRYVQMKRRICTGLLLPSFFVTRGCRMRCPQCIFNWLRIEAKLLSTVLFVWSRALGFQLNWSSVAPALQGSLFFFL